MSAAFKPQAFLCYDFTVWDVSIKGSQPMSTFKKAMDRCAELNHRYGDGSHWVEPTDGLANTNVAQE